MMRGPFRYRQAMGRLKVQSMDVIMGHLLRYPTLPTRTQFEIRPPETPLDAHFPERRRASGQVIGCQDFLADTLRQSWVVGNRPEDHVRIE